MATEGTFFNVGTREGRDAVSKIVRKAKADRIGTAIADLTRCGVLPPYNEILCGKLVAMLMAGPEVVVEYRHRYGGIPSIIASSMASLPVCRIGIHWHDLALRAAA